ncbi:endolytic transglycosylase MltG [Desulfotalea psychrophila]|uniref:Endolytic murein transglycosylase n=1 Tax=Desulfotalea psychrophila (strain LSv54 / DSM 12343) TaxID=177439 RepID=Q6AJ31_DESPS|nr:endolytic transglycosylase MltG [Desulfotalea psychrophila]CAG37649.1 conserved hypothetical protein [Desulfotalea psychrophila LSv54]
MNGKILRYGIVKRVVLGATLFLFLAIGIFFAWLYSYLQTPAPPILDSPSQVVVNIPRGASFPRIQKILAGAGLVNDDLRFALMARYLGLARQVKAGEFALPVERRPVELLRQLVVAKPVQHSVTVPEGLRIEELAAIFAADDWCDAERFISLARDEVFIASLGLAPLPSLEGYLYPDTYYLTRNIHGAEAIIPILVHRFSVVWRRLVAGREAAGEYSRLQLVTLASLVEEEARVAMEQPRIAGVFYNRLKRGIRLQSDPTVLYGLDEHQGPITRTDLRRKTPYNTYSIPGLPRGPICNPGEKALQAVLQPEKNSYLYFVSNNDGTHVFSTNLRDHNRAVYNYRRKLKKERDGEKTGQIGIN